MDKPQKEMSEKIKINNMTGSYSIFSIPGDPTAFSNLYYQVEQWNPLVDLQTCKKQTLDVKL